MKLRTLAVAATMLVTGGAIGTTTQHLASAGISSGERPVLISITPCRLADTRPAPNTVGPRSSKLGAADTMTVDAQEPGTDCTGRIPPDATALSLNVTALGATEQSFLTIWPGGDRPNAASLNPAPGQPPVPNAVVTSLSIDQEFEIFNERGEVNLVVDANGYYVDHDHDDRYTTRADVDAQVAAVDARVDVVDARVDTSKYVALENPTEVGDGDYRIDLTLVVPADYTPGTDPRVHVHLYPGLSTPCRVEIARNYVWGSTPGDTTASAFGADLLDVTSPTDLEFVFVGNDSLQTQVLEFTVDVGDVLQPLDSLSFGFYELAATTCTNGGVLGATLFYE